MKIFGTKLGLFTKNISLKIKGNQILFLKKNQTFAFSTRNEKDVDRNQEFQ
jgi:hypothetical protein